MQSVRVDDSHFRWARLKLSHASSRYSELLASIDDWNVAGHASVEAVQAGPRRIEYRLRVASPPPVDKWSLQLGDALHNLRSSLDSAAWAIANLDGARPPRQPKRIYFPTATDEKNWVTEWAPRFGNVDPVLVARLHDLQQFSFSPGSARGVNDLHRLDIEDKHRGIIEIQPGFVGQFQLDVVPMPPAVTMTGEMVPIQVDRRGAIHDGDLFGGYDSTTDVQLARPTAHRMSMKVGVPLDGFWFAIEELVGTLCTYVGLALDTLQLGWEEATSLAIARGDLEVVVDGIQPKG